MNFSNLVVETLTELWGCEGPTNGLSEARFAGLNGVEGTLSPKDMASLFGEDL
ncbi:hypothetical protein [Corynebacterium phocae]|uniref:hypothetical protein n=1 Tax=Corynebacterium phocae TaxID=161895 RepID=UPI0012EECB23|nr:hypothetical protein [Corynebacterium phocae]